MAFFPALHKVVVANTGGTVVAFEDPPFRLLATLPDMDDADNLRIDAATNQLYVGYGDGALGVIDPATMKRLGDIKLPGHPESFRLEQAGPRIYVNVPRSKEVLVVDRQKRTITSRMALTGFAKNYPMFLDEGHHRLFVGVRAPARLLVLGTQSGERWRTPCVGDTDDLFYDGARPGLRHRRRGIRRRLRREREGSPRARRSARHGSGSPHGPVVARAEAAVRGRSPSRRT